MSSNRKSSGTLVALLAVVALAIPANVAAISPSTGTIASAINYPINTGPLDTFDVHVSGDIAVYTANEHLRYYDFLTGTDSQVPAPVGATDLLGDVASGQITFTRFYGGSARIMVFDVAASTTTEIDPHPTLLRFESSIGNGTVAFIDFTTNSNGDLYAGSVGGGADLVVSDGRLLQDLNVSPDGLHIVFESCNTSPTDCAIREATSTGATWAIQNITADGAEAEAEPDTDGSVIVYDADRGGDREIAWQPIGGGSEHVLTLAGVQRDPSISNGIVSFESVGPGESNADLYLYEIATNRLFQVTVSPSIDDTLNDVFVLPDGTVRVVWSEGSLWDQRDVRGADLILPPVGPTYSFGGFQQPVDRRPTLNQLKAGAAVPVKFSLGGNQGMSIFQLGYPKSQSIACDSTANVDGIETTVTAGGSSLVYDPATSTYTYVWKTDKGWAGTCRQLVLAFADGSVQRANFKLK